VPTPSSASTGTPSPPAAAVRSVTTAAKLAAARAQQVEEAPQRRRPLRRAPEERLGVGEAPRPADRVDRHVDEARGPERRGQTLVVTEGRPGRDDRARLVRRERPRHRLHHHRRQREALQEERADTDTTPGSGRPAHLAEPRGRVGHEHDTEHRDGDVGDVVDHGQALAVHHPH
jgi:hypothetical protein